VPFIFVLFNLGDLLGRYGAGLGPWAANAPRASLLLAYAGARALLAAALLLCNVVTPHAWRLPLLLRYVCRLFAYNQLKCCMPVLKQWQAAAIGATEGQMHVYIDMECAMLAWTV